MAAINKITDLFLKRKVDRRPADVLPTNIAVNFVPSFCNLTDDSATAATADDATHIRLTLNATPPEEIAVLKNLTDPTIVANLAGHIGEAKAALNKKSDGTVFNPPLGLRGETIDDTGVVRYLGGKKSKSKKQLKSKKQKKIKSVRRR